MCRLLKLTTTSLFSFEKGCCTDHTRVSKVAVRKPRECMLFRKRWRRQRQKFWLGQQRWFPVWRVCSYNQQWLPNSGILFETIKMFDRNSDEIT